jgi:hypothetical protein
MSGTDQVFPTRELAERSEFVFAGRIIEPVPVIAATQEKIAMRQNDQMIFVIAPAEVEDQDIIGWQ